MSSALEEDWAASGEHGGLWRPGSDRPEETQKQRDVLDKGGGSGYEGGACYEEGVSRNRSRIYGN